MISETNICFKMKIFFYLIVFSILILLFSSFYFFLSHDPKGSRIVFFKTSLGDFKVEIYEDLMPITTGNFVKLINEDFFDNQRFHRVIEDFIIQAGDPNSKDLNLKYYWGRGGPGYNIEDEFIKDVKLTNTKYTISMANKGFANSSGSQFFINLADNSMLDFDKRPLTSKHPVFGKVIEGFEVVDKIGNSRSGEITIYEIYIK